MKKFITLFLALLLALPICNVNLTARAQEEEQTISAEFSNPTFENSSKQITKTYNGKAYEATAMSKSEAVKQMRNMLKKRYSSFTITFKDSTFYGDDIVTDLIDMACNHTGVPDEGDYLKWHILNGKGDGTRTMANGSYVYSITYTIEYFSTAAQEVEVTNEINKFFKTYNLSKLTDYEKVYIIYEYICNNVDYDYSNSNTRYSAYSAMCKKKAVCQGYSSLLYRMLLTAGVNNRFIGGFIHDDEDGDGAHAWNIVGIKQPNGKTLYYSCDSTFDAVNTDYYYYFLSGNNDEWYNDHVRDPEYATSTFYNAYPMATYNFDCSVINNARYLDVDTKDWYFDVVNKISDLKLMGDTGKHPQLFDPDMNISRGMVAVILYRMAGAPKVNFTQRFKDVSSNQWYANAVTWASNIGIISGYKTGNFGPDDPITREQLAVMLRNYANHCGKNTNCQLSLNSFVDNDNITSYATSAMQWAVQNRILSGSIKKNGTYLNPINNATRGECAKMIYLFYNLVK